MQKSEADTYLAELQRRQQKNPETPPWPTAWSKRSDPIRSVGSTVRIPHLSPALSPESEASSVAPATDMHRLAQRRPHRLFRLSMRPLRLLPPCAFHRGFPSTTGLCTWHSYSQTSAQADTELIGQYTGRQGSSLPCQQKPEAQTVLNSVRPYRRQTRPN